MKDMIMSGCALLTLLSAGLGIAYPLGVTALAQLAVSAPASGSALLHANMVVGSALVGQHWDDPRYFWGRPSSTGPVPYNAAASTGSNLGPSNPALHEAYRQRIAALRAAHPEQQGAPPLDLVAASGSGLDPHISPAAARYQVARVAKARGLPLARVEALVQAHTQERTLGMLGEPRVAVLQLNLGLDGLASGTAP